MIAEYYPPVPVSVKKRARENHHGANEKAVATIAVMYPRG